MIRFAETPQGGMYVNSKEHVYSYGADVSLRWQPSPRITADASLALQRGQDEDGSRLGGVPVVVAHGRLSLAPLATHALLLAPTVRYVGPQPGGGGGDVVVGGGAIWHATEHIDLNLSATNLLGRRVFVPYGSLPPMPAEMRRSRTLRLGLSVAL